MTSATSTSWEKELRKNICTNFGRGIRVNGENSGRTKILYVYNEGLGSANKRTSQTLPIEWKKTSGIEILKAIEFIKQKNDYLDVKDISKNIGFSEQHTRRILRHLFSEEQIIRQDQKNKNGRPNHCLLYTSPSPRD